MPRKYYAFMAVPVNICQSTQILNLSFRAYLQQRQVGIAADVVQDHSAKRGWDFVQNLRRRIHNCVQAVMSAHAHAGPDTQNAHANALFCIMRCPPDAYIRVTLTPSSRIERQDSASARAGECADNAHFCAGKLAGVR